jgi:Domain of unknown function (DUF1707)/Cell wall-active antibiotics response 4TMS YvqF
VRASDAERDRALAVLRDATGEGRLTLEELAERSERALAARTRDELAMVVADLPAPPAAPGRAAGRRWLFGILGGGSHRGRWRVAPKVTVINVMGGADLDLRHAVVEEDEVRITIWSLMGGSDITVPDGVEVDMGGFALLGGDDLDVEMPSPGAGAPVVRVRAYSLMGGNTVKSARG